MWAGKGVPAPKVGLRTGTNGEFRIVLDDDTLVGTVDQGRAYGLVHPGAVYLHQGRAYRVDELDLDHRRAIVEPYDADEYTQARSETSIRVLRSERRRAIGRSHLHLGAVEVTTRVVGYQRRDGRSRRIIANETLDLPPSVLTTRSFWYVVGADVLADAGVDSDAIAGTLHADRARGHRPAAAVHDLRSMGRRRRVDRPPPGHRRAHRVRLRRLPRRRRHRRARLLRGRSPPRGNARGDHRVLRVWPAARRACSRPNAATATSRSTSWVRRRCCAPCSTLRSHRELIAQHDRGRDGAHQRDVGRTAVRHAHRHPIAGTRNHDGEPRRREAGPSLAARRTDSSSRPIDAARRGATRRHGSGEPRRAPTKPT